MRIALSLRLVDLISAPNSFSNKKIFVIKSICIDELTGKSAMTPVTVNKASFPLFSISSSLPTISRLLKYLNAFDLVSTTEFASFNNEAGFPAIILNEKISKIELSVQIIFLSGISSLFFLISAAIF